MKVIAELGINHNGDVALAKKLIDISYSAGCDFVKFQKRNVEQVYTQEELGTPRVSPYGTTTRQQKHGIELDIHEYRIIDHYCLNKIGWFASSWDMDSLHEMGAFKSPFIKIPSALITNEMFVRSCRLQSIKNGTPIILSTGMSDFEIIDTAIGWIGRENIYCIMQCTSTYPTSPDQVNVRGIHALKDRYPWTKIGFSNHYPGLMALVLAAALGAEMLEFHITLDRTMYGSDQASSIEPQGVFTLMERLKLIEQMKGNGQKVIFDSERPIIEKLRR